MKASKPIPILGIASLALIPLTMVSAILATVALDVLVQRPDTPLSGSLNTLLPGFTYAAALVMKVCIAATVVLVIVTLVSRVRSRLRPSLAPAASIGGSDHEHQVSISETVRRTIPLWSILSVAFTPLSILFAALVVLIALVLVNKPNGISLEYFPRVSRIGVFAMMGCICAGLVSAVIALVRRERPRSLPILSLVTNAFLIGMFRYFYFYKLGFDQDKWAEP